MVERGHRPCGNASLLANLWFRSLACVEIVVKYVTRRLTLVAAKAITLTVDAAAPAAAGGAPTTVVAAAASTISSATKVAIAKTMAAQKAMMPQVTLFNALLISSVAALMAVSASFCLGRVLR